jgi:ligand-binding sensor domain-containing protein
MRGFTLIISLLYFSSVSGQQLLFENYTSEQGLSQNSCYTISQDGDGFMWFGTQDGLNRYDGKQFKVFLPQNQVGKKLPSNYITSLFFDSSQNLLWVGTLGGFCFYNAARDSLVSVSEMYPFAAGLAKTSIKKIISFKKDEYWLITYGQGLILLNTRLNKISRFFDDEQNKARVSSIVQHDGKLVAALFNNIYQLRPTKDSYYPEELVHGYVFPEIKELYSYRKALLIGTLTKGYYSVRGSLNDSSNIHPFSILTGGIGCFTEDAKGRLWIGTRGSGIFQYDPATQQSINAAHNKFDSRSPGKNFVLSLFKVRQGIVWCGLSGSGVAKYDPLKYQFESISNQPLNDASLPDDMVFDIFRSKDDRYFVATQNKGLAEWNPSSNSFKPFTASSKIGQVSNTIYDIAEDDKNNMWVASWGGLIRIDRKTNEVVYKETRSQLLAQKLYGIIKLKNADSLLVTGEVGPGFYSLREQLWKPLPETLGWNPGYVGRYMYEAPNSDVWICTVGGGLVKYNYRSNSFAVIDPVRKISVYVRHLLPDNNILWLATDNGIILYDPVNNIVKKHFVLGGIGVSNVCYAIQKDDQGFFWVSTNNGLCRVDPRTFAVRHYNNGNGLTFLEYNTACALKAPDGSLLFGGVGGITKFNPAFLKENTYSPDPLITALNINDSSWNFKSGSQGGPKLEFNHRQNFMTFFFAVNNFSNQNNNQFVYRLKGLSDNWTNCGNRNFANYTSLPPGSYTFQLRSANSDGKWCQGVTTLSFIISPPWWRTWWFRLGAVLALAGAVIYFTRKRINVVRGEAHLKQKLAETEMMALRAQMNPHFIFNSLNSIREMILNNENQEASHFLSKFAHLIRITLDQSGQSFISLRNTIDYLHRYVEMEQVRNAEFTCRILAEDELDLDDTELPPMLIQPFVENAIWHGVTSKEKNIDISIDFRKEKHQLACVIADNGIGINASLRNKINGHDLHHSVGIENIHHRIRLLNEKYNLRSSISIEDKQDIPTEDGPGTIVTIRIPLEINQS